MKAPAPLKNRLFFKSCSKTQQWEKVARWRIQLRRESPRGDCELVFPRFAVRLVSTIVDIQIHRCLLLFSFRPAAPVNFRFARRTSNITAPIGVVNASE